MPRKSNKNNESIFSEGDPSDKFYILADGNVKVLKHTMMGKDIILEHGSEGFYEPLDLGIARCRLMTAARKDRVPVSGRIRVASKDWCASRNVVSVM